MNELKAHQIILIFMCAAIGTLIAAAFFNTIQSLCFGLITGVFTYSFLLSRAEYESHIQFSDFEPIVPPEPYSPQSSLSQDLPSTDTIDSIPPTADAPPPTE